MQRNKPAPIYFTEEEKAHFLRATRHGATVTECIN